LSLGLEEKSSLRGRKVWLRGVKKQSHEGSTYWDLPNRKKKIWALSDAKKYFSNFSSHLVLQAHHG
jgi:hypothetical protein